MAVYETQKTRTKKQAKITSAVTTEEYSASNINKIFLVGDKLTVKFLI